MNRREFISSSLAAASVSTVVARNRGVIDTSESPNVKLRSVNLASVSWDAGFWGDRFNLVRDVGAGSSGRSCRIRKIPPTS